MGASPLLSCTGILLQCLAAQLIGVGICVYTCALKLLSLWGWLRLEKVFCSLWCVKLKRVGSFTFLLLGLEHLANNMYHHAVSLLSGLFLPRGSALLSQSSGWKGQSPLLQEEAHLGGKGSACRCLLLLTMTVKCSNQQDSLPPFWC